MIRRELTHENGTPLWLLISQVQHARISGELARSWNESFSEEVVAAITHHDDGWAKWEATPKLDPRHGRPYSFMEMSLADAIVIWQDSVSAARQYGPLAGWVVAGHFMGLVRGSDRAEAPLAQNWLDEMTGKRTAWLDEWQRESPSHTLQITEQAQQMLLVADLLSLWLCCDGPVSNGSSTTLDTELKTRSAAASGSFRISTRICDVRSSNATGKVLEITSQSTIAPWPLKVDELGVATPAIAAPAKNYQSWEELNAASWPVKLRWQLARA